MIGNKVARMYRRRQQWREAKQRQDALFGASVGDAHRPLPRKDRAVVAHPLSQQVYLPPRGFVAFALLGQTIQGRR